MTPEEIVAAAQRGEPVADYLEERIEREDAEHRSATS